MWRNRAGPRPARTGEWFMLLVVCLMAWRYAEWTWKTVEQAEVITMGLEAKPFVYRALIPFLARGLVELGVRADVALNILVVVSAVGLYYGIKILWRAVR